MKSFILLLFIFYFSFGVFAQEKENPIVFTEGVIGYANGSSKGLVSMFTLNYQSKKDLFTFRFSELTDHRKEGSFFYIPVYTFTEIIQEYSLLYGKRLVEGNTSYSVSAGIALNHRSILIGFDNNIPSYRKNNSIGFPFELNIKWFNSKKESYRIYEIIPIGRPVGFANSIGVKIFGNVSKTTFAGLGITFGLGWHKKY